MRNNYNLGCWETINRLNSFSNVISPNLTGLVMHSACCYTYSLMWRAISSLRLHHDWHLLNIRRFSRQVKKQPIYRYLLHISALLPMTFGHVFSPPISNTTFFATLILYDDIFLVELVTAGIDGGTLLIIERKAIKWHPYNIQQLRKSLVWASVGQKFCPWHQGGQWSAASARSSSRAWPEGHQQGWWWGGGLVF